MGRDEHARAISDLLEATGRAHHQAFLPTDGADPDWAIWYAEHLREALPDALGVPLARAQMVCLLSSLADEHAAQGDMNTPWTEYYSRELVARFVPEVDERLYLYVIPGCPFCSRVVKAIDRLKVEVELRDVFANETHRRDLVTARGRATVPVLRCVSSNADRWMPESADIVRYLERRFAPTEE